MVTNKTKFTEEAKSLLNKYLTELENSLDKTDLTHEEIKSSIDEITNHIISYCENTIEGEELITTDKVSSAIKKLGEPDLISKLFNDEIDFLNDLESNEKKKLSNTSNQAIKSPYVYIRAKDIAMSFIILCWISTITGFFFSLEIYHFYIWVFIYFILIIFLIRLRNLQSYKTNNYLKNTLKLNYHFLIVPIITSLIFLLNNLLGYGFNLVPTIIWFIIPSIMWLLLMTTNESRIYFSKLIQNWNSLFNSKDIH